MNEKLAYQLAKSFLKDWRENEDALRQQDFDLGDYFVHRLREWEANG